MAYFLTMPHLVKGQGGFAVFDAVVDALHHEVHLRPVGQQVGIGAFIPEMDTDDFVYLCAAQLTWPGRTTFILTLTYLGSIVMASE